MKRTIILGVIGVGMLAGLMTPASANHLPMTAGRWEPTHLSGSGSIDWYLELWRTTRFPSGAKSDRILSGAYAWDQHSEGPGINDSFQGTAVSPYDMRTTCPYQAIGGGNVGGNIVVDWTNFGTTYAGESFTDALAVEWTCKFSDGAAGDSNQAYNSSKTWYDGAGDAGDGDLGLGGSCVFSACEFDFWSVASHEFGHTWNFGHFSEDDAVCPNNDSRHTMCPNIYMGTERQRSLESHEISSFHAVY